MDNTLVNGVLFANFYNIKYFLRTVFTPLVNIVDTKLDIELQS